MRVLYEGARTGAALLGMVVAALGGASLRVLIVFWILGLACAGGARLLPGIGTRRRYE